MPAVTPNAENHATLGEFASRHVRIADLPWESTPFPGVETKTLLLDRDNGLVTTLVKMAPGAILPDHEHVLIEQTYMLEGQLVDRDGPDAGLSVGPGEFVWRPAGSRHTAWCPDGGLMLAVFQIPNKFFDDKGAAVDMLGRDWDATWAQANSGAP